MKINHHQHNTQICVGSSANSHQLEGFICKLRVDKHFINKDCVRYHSRTSRLLEHVAVHYYISKVVNDRWLMGIPMTKYFFPKSGFDSCFN